MVIQNIINKIALFLILNLVFCFAQQSTNNINFSSENWKTLGSAKVKEYDSKLTTSVSEGVGIAYLDKLEFQNGIIECDLLSPSTRAYLGLVFRINSLNNFECIYFQPHTSGKWDAVQYDPIFNGSPTWQLYNGNSYQAVADIPINRWFHVKMEVFGDTAKVYLNNVIKPTFTVKLKHKQISGSIGVYSYHPAIFTNLKVTMIDTLVYSEPKPNLIVKEKFYISNWLISDPYNNYSFTKDLTSVKNDINKWYSINGEENYLINLNKHFTKSTTSNTVLAKVYIHSKILQKKILNIGYSDKIRIFLNSKSIFTGNNSYIESGRYEDRGYVLDEHTKIELPLVKGENELIIEISEDKFGWGFISQLSDLKGIEIKN